MEGLASIPSLLGLYTQLHWGEPRAPPDSLVNSSHPCALPTFCSR